MKTLVVHISGTSCAYSDTILESESAVRGLTTRFEVVKGQFMNRVTGVKEGTGEQQKNLKEKTVFK